MVMRALQRLCRRGPVVTIVATLMMVVAGLVCGAAYYHGSRSQRPAWEQQQSATNADTPAQQQQQQLLRRGQNPLQQQPQQQQLQQQQQHQQQAAPGKRNDVAQREEVQAPFRVPKHTRQLGDATTVEDLAASTIALFSNVDSDTLPHYTLVVVIPSGPNTKAMRNILRDTWLRLETQLVNTIRPFSKEQEARAREQALAQQKKMAAPQAGAPADASLDGELVDELDLPIPGADFDGLDQYLEDDMPLWRAFEQEWLASGAATTAVKRPASVRHFFAIGTSGLDPSENDYSDSSMDKDAKQRLLISLMDEQDQHGDLLFLPAVPDGYSRLSLKVLHSMRAIESLPFTYSFLLKCDMDSYVRLDVMVPLLHAVEQEDSITQVLGPAFVPTTVFPPMLHTARPERIGPADRNLAITLHRERLYWGFMDGRAPVKKAGKWGESSWFLSNNYLPYALGGGYVLSQDLVGHIARTAPLLQLYFNEDLSVGTWLAPLLIHRVHDPRFDTEFKSRGCDDRYLVSHPLLPADIIDKYKRSREPGSGNRICAKQEVVRPSYQYNWHLPPTECCPRGSWPH
ncbi:beta-1,3-galactosyltransferase 6 [Capsaspora owczarzaki ATCC 30864]|uniref:Beta-1,3-galactosyltransferase 6 n=1 Tax=Capsaspora owczarzaki (strain ATCC 30864) TaxID=595528 RepID=A0A0D2UCH9_CAPO3|nr:beta-1,3-galactosyltransferase 6 [Capsaspora owczarzaki ATCC 30864]KJE92736.1 beta-1,3-galactosyltransferase 6 [Capsaspora owczarzaki ATCC 30864]|eukprot:XP_004363374.2 beta-1,3-galactosyltransferase 6 [Capsaspora owczarzaki ATCC 30864]